MGAICFAMQMKAGLHGRQQPWRIRKDDVAERAGAETL